MARKPTAAAPDAIHSMLSTISSPDGNRDLNMMVRTAMAVLAAAPCASSGGQAIPHCGIFVWEDVSAVTRDSPNIKEMMAKATPHCTTMNRSVPGPF